MAALVVVFFVHVSPAYWWLMCTNGTDIGTPCAPLVWRKGSPGWLWSKFRFPATASSFHSCWLRLETSPPCNISNQPRNLRVFQRIHKFLATTTTVLQQRLVSVFLFFSFLLPFFFEWIIPVPDFRFHRAKLGLINTLELCA